jgi:tRNA-dihydrouridine synthase 1
MVEQSELPYRLLAREHGAGLCFSPMVHSRHYAEGDAAARTRMFETNSADRPLVV